LTVDPGVAVYCTVDSLGGMCEGSRKVLGVVRRVLGVVERVLGVVERVLGVLEKVPGSVLSSLGGILEGSKNDFEVLAGEANVSLLGGMYVGSRNEISFGLISTFGLISDLLGIA